MFRVRGSHKRVLTGTRDYANLDIDMMVQTQAAKTKKPNLMAATWTKAGMVRRAFKAGRPLQKDRVLTTRQAIWEACLLRESLYDAMRKAGLSADDVQAAIVLMTPDTPTRTDLIYVFPIPQTRDLVDLFSKVARIEKAESAVPLGVAIRQLDHEAADPKDPKSGAVVWVQPFLANTRAATALLKARQVFADTDGSGGKSTFS